MGTQRKNNTLKYRNTCSSLQQRAKLVERVNSTAVRDVGDTLTLFDFDHFFTPRGVSG